MSLTWTPIKMPFAPSPEQAFAAGARHSHDSKIILLAWVKGVGWCGCRGFEVSDSDKRAGTDMLLLRVDNGLIMYAERGGLPYHSMTENGNANP